MSNSWWEIEIECNPNQEESIYYWLEEFGCRGTATQIKGESCTVRAYLAQMAVSEEDLAAFASRIRAATEEDSTRPTVRWRSLAEEDWANSWKQHWQPTPIGDRWLICPAWLEPPAAMSNRIVIRLDPGAAFGTGTHPTTQLCLQALAQQDPLNTLADLGCGSGILSLAALLLGTEQVYAVDIDSLAVKATDHNRQLNGIEASRLKAQSGSIKKLSNLLEEGVDGIVCNILAEVIIALIPQFEAIARPTTIGILSGILTEQAEAVTTTLAQYGWEVIGMQTQQQWCCLQIKQIKHN